MGASLSYNSILKLERSLNKELWQMNAFVKKQTIVNIDDSEQKAKLDEEKLQEWRLRMKQIRAPNNN